MRILLTTLLIFACSAIASAQEGKIQRVSFYGYQTVEYPTIIYLRSGPGKFTELQLPGSNTTESVPVVNVQGGFGIFGAPTKNAEGEDIYPRLCRIKCSPNSPRAFAILSSVKRDGKIAFSGHAFPMTNKDFPEGSLKIANLSPALVRGKLGSQQAAFRPGEISTLKFNDPVGELIDVIFQYKTQKDDKWSRMISTRWPVPADGRRLLFIFPDPSGKGMRSKTIPIRKDRVVKAD
ncbi:MAG: hypothetical protein ACSHYB_16630 [Roseibacillus sp.]